MGTKIRDLPDIATSIDDNDFLVLASTDNKTKKISGANFKSSVSPSSSVSSQTAGIHAIRLVGSNVDVGSGDAFSAVSDQALAANGTPAVPGIYCLRPSYLRFLDPPYYADQTYIYDNNGINSTLVAPPGVDTHTLNFWIGADGRPPESNGLMWKDNKLLVMSRSGRQVFHASYDVTIFYIPF